MTDPSCSGPSCTFPDAGEPGDCSGTAGILIYAEIVATNQSLLVLSHQSYRGRQLTGLTATPKLSMTPCPPSNTIFMAGINGYPMTTNNLSQIGWHI